MHLPMVRFLSAEAPTTAMHAVETAAAFSLMSVLCAAIKKSTQTLGWMTSSRCHHVAAAADRPDRRLRPLSSG